MHGPFRVTSAASRCLDLQGMEPTERLARSSPRYKLGASLSRPGGRVGAEPGNCTLPLVLTKDLLRCLSLIGVSGLPSWSRTSATRLRRARAAFHRPGEYGCPPRCRTVPSPLIWQLSRAYKAPPHTGAEDIIWCVRWESNPQHQGSRPCTYANSVTNAWLASPVRLELTSRSLGGRAPILSAGRSWRPE